MRDFSGKSTQNIFGIISVVFAPLIRISDKGGGEGCLR